MGQFYNKLRSPVAASLGDGSSVSFPPKKWTRLSREQEGAAQVLQYVKKGILAYKPDPKPAAPPPPPVVEVNPENLEMAPVPSPVSVDLTPVAKDPVPVEQDPVPIEDPSPASSDHVVAVPEGDEADFETSDDNSVASDTEVDTSSKTTRRSKTRRR